MSDVIKSGYVKRFSKSFMDGGWKKIWLVLHKNSKLELFKKQSDTSPKGHVVMKEVCKYFAVGKYTENMPERPSLPRDGKMEWLLAVPQKPSSQAKIHWFLFDSDKELNEWMEAIVSTLPPVPSHHQGPDVSAPTAPQQPVFEEVQAVKSNPVSAPLPPAGYPAQPPYNAGPPVGVGFDQMSISQQRGAPPPAGGYYPPPAYPQQPAYQPPPPGYQQPYPTQQPYPQQPYYPQQPAGAAYPRQPYAGQPAQGYAQGYYTPQGQYVAYPQGQYAAYPQGQYVQQQPNVVYVKEKKNKGILGSSTGQVAAGLAGGALLGYGASRMMGGPFGYGGFGMGRWGSWSSLSSCGSFGSFSSFGSWD